MGELFTLSLSLSSPSFGLEVILTNIKEYIIKRLFLIIPINDT